MMTRRQFLAGVGGASVASWLLAQAQVQERPVGPIRVGSSRQLFIDEVFFAQRQGVQLVVNRPTPTGERCLVADRPWEGHRICAYNSVLEEDGRLKLYYDAIAPDDSRWLCFATSQDGVHWEKPALDIVPFGAHHQTNIVFPPAPWGHAPGCVFRDTSRRCLPDERYKLACYLVPPGGPPGTYVAASPDGLHWRLLGDGPAFRVSDTGNICFFDHRVGRYVGYVRVADPMRKVGRIETAHPARWGQERVVFSYDDQDQAGLHPGLFSGMDCYNSAALKYPGARDVYLLFPTAYYHYQPAVAERRAAARGRPWGTPDNDGPMDIQLATSRDGIRWTRLDRQPFLRLGLSGAWDGGCAYLAAGCVLRRDEIWLYYATADYTHGNYEPSRDRQTGTLTRAVLRRDGFVCVQAGYGGGEFTTPPLVFWGQELALNAVTTAGGHVRVELQDEQGRPLGGYSAAECDPINGNYLHQVISWRGRRGVGELARRPVRVRFLMRDARLYAFQFGG